MAIKYEKPIKISSHFAAAERPRVDPIGPQGRV